MITSWPRRLLPSGVRRYRILGGPLRGYSIYASLREYPRAVLGRAERGLTAWFLGRVEPGSIWLDVGSHYGYTALVMCSRVGPSGQVFAFEPALPTAGWLAKTREVNRLNQLSVLPFGLADVETLTVVRASTSWRGMVVVTPNMLRKPLENRPGESVCLLALDHIWKGLFPHEQRVAGIKVDVQGMEASALRGMSEILREHKPRLVVEHHSYADVSRLFESLEQAGYEPTGIDVNAPSSLPTDALEHGHSYEFFPRS